MNIESSKGAKMTLKNKTHVIPPFHTIRIDNAAFLALQKYRIEQIARGERPTILEAASAFFKTHPGIINPEA